MWKIVKGKKHGEEGKRKIEGNDCFSCFIACYTKEVKENEEWIKNFKRI